jgi:hypothetical protein
MAKKYHDHVESLKKAQIVLAAICLVLLVFYIYYVTKPKITSYELKDECGPISGSVMHSINNQDSCSNACNAYCLSKKITFSDAEFTVVVPCNTCMCRCKG